MWARDMCLAWGHAGLRALLSRKVLRIRSRRSVEIAFNHKNGEIIVEVIAAEICRSVIDFGHDVLGGQ
jgi:hypothetical protein